MVSRRSTVKLLGAGLVAPGFGGIVSSRSTTSTSGQTTTTSEQTTTTSGQSTVETVVDIPSEEKVPENLAIDSEGTLYFGITAGEVWRITAEQTQQTGLTLDDAEQVGTLPGSAIGVEVGPEGSLYVASQADSGTGVWQVPQDGSDPSLFAAISPPNQDQVFPNDVLYDADRERLLVTESFGGAVYEVPLDAGDPSDAASVWVEADSLDTESFGANGLAFGPDGEVFVAVTRATNDAGEDVGRLVRVGVGDDGSATGAELYVESPSIFGADGITTRDRDVYVAANSLNEVVRVSSGTGMQTETGMETETETGTETEMGTETGTQMEMETGAGVETETIASGDDGLVFPSDVVFGTVEQQQNDLFICNFANENPTEGAILRTTVEGS